MVECRVSGLDTFPFNLTSTNGTTTITAAQDQISRSLAVTTQNYNDMSANYNRGRVSADSNSKVLEETTTTNTVTQKQSNLSAGNDIVVNSRGDINLLSSNLTADNNTTLNSTNGNVNILALQNTTTTTKETREGTLTLSAGIGNSHVDTIYAAKDLVDATKALADAKNNLSHMKTLRDNGQADDEAVKDAEINFAIAGLNLYLADLKYSAATAKSVASANSLWTGFYADLKLIISGTKTNSNTSESVSVASNIVSNNDITITSGSSLTSSSPTILDKSKGNTTITGAKIVSDSGDINIASKNNTIIEASKDTYNANTTSKSWQSNLTLASTAGSGTAAMIDNAINSLALSLSTSRSKSDTNVTNYNNSTLTAQNGAIKITSLNDTTIKGVNILADDTTINTVNNLDIESLQNSYNQKAKSFGLSLGAGASGTVSPGINYSSSKTDRLWTDNQTTIIGTNSVTINTGNNTNNTGAVIANITNADELLATTNKTIGANAIDGENLTLNTKTLTFKNLDDHYYTQNFGANFSTSIGVGVVNATSGQGTAAADNPNQQINFYPTGSTTIGLQDSSSKKEQVTKATIGEGNVTTNANIIFDSNGNPITITGGDLNSETALANLNRDVTKSQVITRDQITGALDVSVTIDNRLLAAIYEIATDKTLTKEEKAAGKELNKDILAKEFWGQGGNTLVNGFILSTTLKDAVTSFSDINENDPNNSNYFSAFNNNQKLRFNAIFGTDSLLAESKDAKYYSDPNDNKKGFYDPKTNQIYINQAYATNENNLMNTILHETFHKDNNLDQNIEETLANNYSIKVSDLINFYHNTNSYEATTLGSLASWAYSNSSISSGYNNQQNFTNNWFENTQSNINPIEVIGNNFVVRGIDQGRIEPDVAFRLDRTRTAFGHTIGYFQNVDGKWLEYQQTTPDNASTIGALLNLGYKQEITALPQYTVSPMQSVSITEEMLKNNPDIIYIKTSKEQDRLVAQNVLQKIDAMDDERYRLWTNNCNISFASVCANAGIKLPEIVARPDKFHQALKEMYVNPNHE